MDKLQEDINEELTKLTTTLMNIIKEQPANPDYTKFISAQSQTMNNINKAIIQAKIRQQGNKKLFGVI